MKNNHPCFNKEAHSKYARVHLPVAPKCNVQCNYCSRKYDCVNESRPGVTSQVLSPFQALQYYKEIKEKIPNLSVVGIAGPGDPMANPQQTLETFKLIREYDKEVSFCLSTNGITLDQYADDLIKAGISHLTVTVNSIRPETIEKIYAWARPEKKVFRGGTMGEEIRQRQLNGIRKLRDAGILLKINTILLPGINEDEIGEIASFYKSEGADLHNVIPLKPVEETPFADLHEPTPAELKKAQAAAGEHLQQMVHCQRCRADAVGLLGKDNPKEIDDLMRRIGQGLPTESRPYTAVCSREGFLINQHLGEAVNVNIYSFEKGEVKFIEERTAPDPGTGDDRWGALAEMLKDCSSLLTSGVGPRPKNVLNSSGLTVHVLEGLISEAINRIYTGGDLGCMINKGEFSCGSGCQGTGMGCG
ncbi:MAG: radical SAM protein [Spirochaetales bacterium]|nr:radical SAM protein [Spirochaetales bacterium]